MVEQLQSDNPTGGIQVISRAAAIMRALAVNSYGMSLAEIADVVSLPRSTVHRIIRALESEFLVTVNSSHGGYSLGPAIGQMINQTQSDIISLVKPHISALSEQVNETVCLCYLVDGNVYVADRIIAEHPLQVTFPVGVISPAPAVAVGKVLLATLEKEAVSALLPDKIQLGVKGNIPKAQFLQELNNVSTEGYAVDCSELIEGVSTLAVTIDTFLGTFSIGLVMPEHRVDSRKSELIEALLSCQAAINSSIGKKGTLSKRFNQQ